MKSKKISFWIIMAILTVGVLAIIVHGSVWYGVHSGLSKHIDNYKSQLLEKGYALDYRFQSGGGYPFSHRVKFTDILLKNPTQTTSLFLPELSLELPFDLVNDKQISFAILEGAKLISHARMSSIVINQGLLNGQLQEEGQAITLQLSTDNLALSLTHQHLFTPIDIQIKRPRLTLYKSNFHDWNGELPIPLALNFDFKWDELFAPIKLGQGLINIDWRGPFFEGEQGLEKQLREWHGRNGSVTLNQFDLIRDASRIKLSGQFKLDPAMRPLVDAKIDIYGDVFKEISAINREISGKEFKIPALASFILGTIGTPAPSLNSHKKGTRIPLTIKDGIISIAQFKITEARPLF